MPSLHPPQPLMNLLAAGVVVMLASGQGELPFDLGPAAPVAEVDEPAFGPRAAGNLRIDSLAQFETDGPAVSPAQSPELPTSDDFQPFGFGDDASEPRPADPGSAGTAPVWTDANGEAPLEPIPADTLEPTPAEADRLPRSPLQDLADELGPIPLLEELPPDSDDAADDDAARDDTASDDTADEQDAGESVQPTPRRRRTERVPVPGAGGMIPFGSPVDPDRDFAEDDDAADRDYGNPSDGLADGPVLPDAVVPEPAAPRRSLRLPSGEANGEAVRLAIDGRFLGRLFERSGCNRGTVNDRIMDATVVGNQTTRTQTRLQLVPDAATARMNLELTGQTQSLTVGATDQADVTTQSLHRFRLEKPIAFDGRTFQTRSPGATVWPQNVTTGAQARVGQRVPVVRRMASRIAYEEAQRRRVRSEQIAARRVTDRVAGEFNTQADAGLARLQTMWQTRGLAALDRLLESGEQLRTATTDRHVLLRLPTAALPDADPPRGWAGAGESMTLAIHETAVNAALAQLDLEGQELEQGRWRRLVKAILPSARFRTESPTTDSSLAKLRLTETDPIEVRFADGQVQVELHAVVTTPLGDSPPQRIVMPWTVAVRGDETIIDAADVEVTALEDESSGLLDIIREGIETRFAAEIEPLTLRRTLDAPVGDRSLPVTLTYYRARDGWLLIGWEASLRDE